MSGKHVLGTIIPPFLSFSRYVPWTLHWGHTKPPWANLAAPVYFLISSSVRPHLSSPHLPPQPPVPPRSSSNAIFSKYALSEHCPLPRSLGWTRITLVYLLHEGGAHLQEHPAPCLACLRRSAGISGKNCYCAYTVLMNGLG